MEIVLPMIIVMMMIMIMMPLPLSRPDSSDRTGCYGDGSGDAE